MKIFTFCLHFLQKMFAKRVKGVYNTDKHVHEANTGGMKYE